MKFSSVIAAMLASTAAAAPSAPVSSATEHGLLAARQATNCWANNINNATTATSPLATDCEALSASNLAGPWTPSEANGYSFDVRSGTCGFRAVFDPSLGSGSMDPSDFVVRPDMVSLVLDHAVERFTVDGRVGATGGFLCLIPGFHSEVGWANYEIYNTAE